MRIAYFLDIPKGMGGAGNVLLEQAKLMNKIHDVIVVIPCDSTGEMNPEYERRCRKAHIRCRGMAYSTTYTIQNIDMLNAWKAAKSIQKMAMEERVDFFHSVQLNIGAELAARELGIPHLMNIYQLRKEEFVLQCMDIFPRYHSCDSYLYCGIWKKYLGVKTCCIRPSAILPYIEKKKREPKTNFKIVMLSGFEERKNHMTAIQAVEKCNHNGFRIELTIAGNADSCFAQKCRDYIEEKKLYEFIHIVGFQTDIVPLLRENDGYLCASTEESFPSSIVEAMTYDLTVISTPVAGVPELLKDGINAYITDGYSVENIADTLIRCCQAYKDRTVEKIHKGSETLWKENFSQDAVRKKLNDYYTYILDDYQKCEEQKRNNIISESDICMIDKALRHVGITDAGILSRNYYYACLKPILHTGNAYIWGAGRFGEYAKRMLEILFPQINVSAYVDSKKSGTYLGLPIISPKQIGEEEIAYIFLGFREGREEVITYLQEKKYEYNKKVWIFP